MKRKEIAATLAEASRRIGGEPVSASWNPGSFKPVTDPSKVEMYSELYDGIKSRTRAKMFHDADDHIGMVVTAIGPIFIHIGGGEFDNQASLTVSTMPEFGGGQGAQKWQNIDVPEGELYAYGTEIGDFVKGLSKLAAKIG